MSWEKEKIIIGKTLVKRFYLEGYLQTLHTASDLENRESGWRLKKKEFWELRSSSKEEDFGDFSVLFLNLRPLGKDPLLLSEVGEAMAMLAANEMPLVSSILGIEMAGIPIAVATSLISKSRLRRNLPYCYTRPLPEKARTPEDADTMLRTYGGKSLVEGEINDGDIVALWDDMITNSGSKVIALKILKFEALRRGVPNVITENVGVVLDREQGGKKELREQGITLHSFIPLKTDGLWWLKNHMQPEEFALVKDYQENEEKYQDPDSIEWVLKNRKPL